MSSVNVDSLLLNWLSKLEEIDAIVKFQFPNIGKVFGNVSLSKPKFGHSELGFIRMTSWLFAHYHEVGSVSIKFLEEKFVLYNIEGGESLSKHLGMVRDMRTFLQHHMDLERDRNEKVFKSCQEWLCNCCGSGIPSKEEQWSKCLNQLCVDANAFMDAILSVVREVEADESRESIALEWRHRLDRSHKPHEFDPIIQIASRDMGVENLDVIGFRKKFYNNWVSKLQYISLPYDFASEARKLVESSFLAHFSDTMPINGEDIIALGLNPGPEVRRHLEWAKISFSLKRCDKNELLMRVTERLHKEDTESI